MSLEGLEVLYFLGWRSGWCGFCCSNPSIGCGQNVPGERKSLEERPGDRVWKGDGKVMIFMTRCLVSNILYFHPYLGKTSNLTNIFQVGWFNHQLDDDMMKWWNQFSHQLGGAF